MLNISEAPGTKANVNAFREIEYEVITVKDKVAIAKSSQVISSHILPYEGKTVENLCPTPNANPSVNHLLLNVMEN